MRRRPLLALGAAIAGIPARALAQTRDIPLVGLLISGAATGYYSTAQFRDEMTASGRGEGSVDLEVRAADGQYDRLPGLARELLQRGAKVIVAFGLPAALAAKGETQTVPIVFTSGADPVAMGLASSLGRPGSNLTGFTNYFGQIGAKRFELLCELVPKAGTFGVLVNPVNANAHDHVANVVAAARALGRTAIVENGSSDAEISAAFARLAAAHVDALYVSDDPSYAAKVKLLVGLAARHSLPTSYHSGEFTAAGGLMSYGARVSDAVRIAALYTVRILKGERPGDLPVQQPEKFYLSINLKTARALGLAVPPLLLARADEVIE